MSAAAAPASSAANGPDAAPFNPLLDGPLSPVPPTRFRQLLARPGIIAAPGVCDGISARCALEAGFEVLYQSGAATTASRLGQPDLAIATMNDFVQSAQMITSLVNVISGGLTPSFTIKEAEEMGAKIIIFSLVSAVAAVHGIRAAMHSLKKTGTDFTSAQGMDPRAFFELLCVPPALGACPLFR
ncbi:hypothetical protein JB92DRAFT_1108052 [Gautieria morchelliformis]|nr:hypothetical protein JB92DRAFT_1108052 [Gautieria morchelliformis]